MTTVQINHHRRLFVGASVIAATFAMIESAVGATGATPPGPPKAGRGTIASFAPMKQIDAGILNVGYAEAGPADGPAVILLHGWPYDIHTYVDVAPLLAAAGYRVIVPHLRGYGTTRFLSAETFRNGQQSVFAVDIIALMDALRIEKAIIGGCDWGARTANILAALWPERCKAMVSVSGYLIGNREPTRCRCRRRPSSNGGTNITLPRNAAGPATTSTGMISRSSSGSSLRRNGTSTMPPSSAAPRPSTIRITSASSIHNYRWRLSLAEGDPQYDDLERRLAEGPVIAVPTITLEGDANGAPHPDAASYAGKFSGKYAHRIVTGGIGHNLPQEAPQAFAKAVIDVGSI